MIQSSKKILFKTNQIITRIFSYTIASHFKVLPPKKILIVLTYLCNSRCIMCSIWKNKPTRELSEKEWTRILKDKIFQTIEELDITGGEALLKQNFEALLPLFIDAMPKLHHISIVSNGFATEKIRENVLLLLKKAEKRKITVNISVSLDAIGEDHEKIRGIPHAFQKVKKTLSMLQTLQKKYTFSISIGSMLMEQTITEIKRLEQWAKKKHIEQDFQLVGFHQTYVNNMQSEKNINFSKKNVSLLHQTLKKLGKSRHWKHFEAYYWKDMYFMYKYGFKRSTPCPFLYDEFAIDALGNIYNCLSENSIGNIKKGKTVSDIYFSKNTKTFRTFLRKNRCQTCNSSCSVREGIIGDAKKYIWFLLTRTPWYGIKQQIQILKNKNK